MVGICYKILEFTVAHVESQNVTDIADIFCNQNPGDEMTSTVVAANQCLGKEPEHKEVCKVKAIIFLMVLIIITVVEMKVIIIVLQGGAMRQLEPRSVGSLQWTMWEGAPTAEC